jgi:hypothetical protein
MTCFQTIPTTKMQSTRMLTINEKSHFHFKCQNYAEFVTGDQGTK